MTEDLTEALEATFGTDDVAVATRGVDFVAPAVVKGIERQAVEA